MAYELGKQFVVDYKNSKTKPSMVFQGKKYRISVLTERLVRFEYSEEGIFEDRPSQLALFRDFEKFDFVVKQDDKYLEISTNYFSLEYKKEKSFYSGRFTAGNNLIVNLKNTDKQWFFGHTEIRNCYSCNVSLDGASSNAKLKKGLYSTDGFSSLDDSGSLVLDTGGMFIERKDKKAIDTYVFFYRKDFRLCLRDYFLLTGKPPLIPRYALGNWWGKNEAYTEDDIKNVLYNFSKNEIPIAALTFSNYWHLRMIDEKKYDSGYTFNKNLIKEPFDFISFLHSKNIYVGLMTNPSEGLMPYDEMYKKAISYMESEDNKPISFIPLNPRFIDIYLKLMIHPNDILGVDFWWIDYYNKKDLVSLYLLNHFHYFDQNRNPKKRSLILSRNSLIAPHRYPIHYSGKIKVSWDTLSLIPYFNANSSNIGMSWWSHDIGGTCDGIEDNELYTRFLQLGCFSPIFRLYSEEGKYYKREPWKWSIRTLSIAKKYMQLRHRLIPYLYTEAYNYSNKGTLIFQPIYYFNPDMYDDMNVKKEYYFGSELLVSPITSKKNYLMNRTVHKFYLPKGMWYDFITGKKFPGDREYTTFFKEEDYPVFARAGSIIPLNMDGISNDVKAPDNMEIQIFPGVSNEYRLYEDDGITDNYKLGYSVITSIDYNYLKSNYTVVIRPIAGKKGIIPEYRNYVIRFRNTKYAETVIAYLNDKKIETNSYVDGPDFVVEIDNVSTISQLTLNCKGEDIEIDATRLINEDIDSIISEIAIETSMKEEIASILFSDLSIRRKRIAIRKLKRKKLDRKFIRIFLNLLEYVEQV